MDWWIWVAAGIAAVFLLIDWLIIRGADPRKKEGGKKSGKRETDHHAGADR